MQNIVQEIKVGAVIKLIASKSDGKIARETGWFHNLVLDAGLVRMTQNTWFDRCCVGAGNSTPIASQSALDSFIASTTTVQSTTSNWDSTTTPTYIYERRTWRFGQGVAAGNISEVGLGWENNALWNRALVKDINGNPTTITVLSDEYLDVVCEVRVYPTNNITGGFSLKDKNGNVVSSHNYTATVSLGVGVWGGVSQVKLNGAGLTGIYNSLGSVSNSTSGSTVNSVWTLGLNDGNATHNTLYFRYTGIFPGNALWGYKVQFSPNIVKSATQIMTYSVSLVLGRYTP